MKNSKTGMIKSRFSNQVHQILSNKTLSDSQKMAQIKELDNQTSNTLHKYWSKRKRKALIAKLRAERGYVPKKKTTYAQWLKMCEQMKTA